VNLESAIPSAKAKDDPWIVRIVVDEVRGGARAGMTLVRGRQIYVDGQQEMFNSVGEVRFILAGEGVGSGMQSLCSVEVGKRVGMKGPIWEVLLEGGKWGVCVEWKVLLNDL
jgi:hypothetical protein